MASSVPAAESPPAASLARTLSPLSAPLARGRGPFGAASLGAALALLSPGARAVEAAFEAGSALPEATPGDEIVFANRPAWMGESRACSFREPICVHAPEGTSAGNVMSVLASAERAWDAATWGLRLPAPDVDPATGAFDVYLTEGVLGGAEAVLGARDAVASFDRASAFLRVDGTLAGCALDLAIARETAHAILFRVAPATDATTARAETAYLARLMVPCAFERPGGIDVYQSHPQVSVAGTIDPGARESASVQSVEYAAGASLFYWWLDYSFGNSPGDIVRALWALAPTITPPSARSWSGRPDGFDVMRATFKDAITSGSTFDDLLLEFAVARAFVGSASDADHMPETRALGPAGRPRVDWSIAWPGEPRRLASGIGIEPTGSAYVEVSCREAAKGARLRFEADWEEHAKMRWAAVKIDASGHELSAVAVPGHDRGTEARFTVVDLEGVARVLFVAASTGDPSQPFDPNDRNPEPHGWLVSLASEAP